MRHEVYICAHALWQVKCVYRKLNVVDFQCKHMGKYKHKLVVQLIVKQSSKVCECSKLLKKLYKTNRIC